MNRKKAPPRALLTLIFTIVVFIILVVTMIIVGCVIFFLTQIGVLGISQTASAPIHFQIIIFAMTSIVIGTIVAALGSHFPLRPLNTLIEAMNQLAHGKYDIRINLGKHRISQELTDSFNTMAEELENTEIFHMNLRHRLYQLKDLPNYYKKIILIKKRMINIYKLLKLNLVV